jgi:hypothetical protein
VWKNRVVGAALVAALGQPSRACGTPTARFFHTFEPPAHMNHLLETVILSPPFLLADEESPQFLAGR